jgi:hypothetical protein
MRSGVVSRDAQVDFVIFSFNYSVLLWSSNRLRMRR